MPLIDDIRRIVREDRPEGLTDYRLAQLLGWPRSVLSRFLADGGDIRPDRLNQLADLFGITVAADPKRLERALKLAERERKAA